MSVNLLTDPGGLFVRLGRLAHFMYLANVYQDATAGANIDAIVNQFAYPPPDSIVASEPDLIGAFAAAKDNNQLSAGAPASQLVAIAVNTVNRMVYKDNPQASKSNLSLSLIELIRQMKANSESVDACAVTATSTVDGFNVGDGVVALSTKRGDGLVNENMFSELADLRCVLDAQTGGVGTGNERFTFSGDPSVTDVWRWDWPLGSGASASVTAASAAGNNALGNLLSNSDFEDFTTNTPDKWVITVGSAGTEVLKSTTQFFDGVASLELVGGATATALTQVFDDAAGTTASLDPDTVYLVNFWVRVSVVPAAGVLTVELIDGASGAGTVIDDDQAVANAFTVSLPGATTSWVNRTGAFRTPKVMPADMRLRMRLSTALSAGSSAYIDRLAMTAGTLAYSGGPYLSVFSGAIPFILGDWFLITTDNDQAGSAYGGTWQAAFDRFFNMRGLGLLLPSSGAPTIADTLITT